MRRRTFLRSGVAVAGLAVGLPRVTGERGRAGYGPIAEVEIEGAKELVTDGTTGYVAATDGYATVDLSDPADPAVMAEERDLFADYEGGPLAGIYDVKQDGDLLVVAGPAQGGQFRGFGVYDVSDPANPSLQGFKPTETTIHNCDVSEGYVYVTGNDGQGNPLIVYDATGEDITRLTSWSPVDHDDAWADVNYLPRVLHDVYVENGVAYCAYWDAGTWLVDVSDPANPSYITHFGEYTREELASWSSAEVRENYIDRPGNAHYPHVSDDGTLYGIGGESWDGEQGDGEGGPSGIDLYDLSDVTSPQKLSSVDPTPVEDATQGSGVWTTAHNFEISNERLYSSWYQDGVKLHDLSDPANPELLAHWRQPRTHRIWTAQVVEPGEYFAASNMGMVGYAASILTFPDEAGEQRVMPALEPTPTPSPSPTASPTPTDSPSSSTSTTPGTDSPTPGSSATPSETATGTPGLGPLAAVGGLSLAGWRLLTRRRDD